MRRTIKRTLIVTSTETWTISFESSQPIEIVQTEETPPAIANALANDDRPSQHGADRDAADVLSANEAHSDIAER